MRQFVGLVIGLVIGIAGAILFSQSLPPEEGSIEERLEETAFDLEKAQMQIKALRAEGRTGRAKRTSGDGLRSIAEDVKAGRAVDLDDVFDAAKPWMRDMAPLFDRIRVKEQKSHFDRLAGEWTREYGLNRRQQMALERWFEAKAEENAEAFSAVVTDEKSGFEDMVRATQDFEDKMDGVDTFMGSMLEGETLTKYQDDRMVERVEQVQHEADRKVQRLDRVVQLDEGQKDQVFTMMARSSEHFDPGMGFEGLDGDGGQLRPGAQRDEAVMAVLRPEQVQMYENHRRERIEETERELGEIGLKLPEGWDLLDEDDF